jgi:hypothetical protein
MKLAKGACNQINEFPKQNQITTFRMPGGGTDAGQGYDCLCRQPGGGDHGILH